MTSPRGRLPDIPVGLATAYIPRPLEWGLDGPPVDPPDADFDIVATDFGYRHVASKGLFDTKTSAMNRHDAFS